MVDRSEDSSDIGSPRVVVGSGRTCEEAGIVWLWRQCETKAPPAGPANLDWSGTDGMFLASADASINELSVQASSLRVVVKAIGNPS